MYAVMETGGKQYKVSPGDRVKIEKVDGKKGEQVILNRVLAVMSDRQELKPGSPYIQDAAVKAKIIAQSKDRKIMIFKYKRRKRRRVKRGHRQPYTLIEVESIETGETEDIKLPEEKPEKAEIKKEVKVKKQEKTGTKTTKITKAGTKTKKAEKTGTKAKTRATKKAEPKTKTGKAKTKKTPTIAGKKKEDAKPKAKE
ncbi:MAG: 50S ribosomal protein L21 [Candidatus Eremiobacteraeota bacterium]|nr:50S ribosomal protein L21 [Candidatus Eremiobacteraeota bacterium]